MGKEPMSSELLRNARAPVRHSLVTGALLVMLLIGGIVIAIYTTSRVSAENQRILDRIEAQFADHRQQNEALHTALVCVALIPAANRTPERAAECVEQVGTP